MPERAIEPPFNSRLDPRYTQLPDGSPGRPAEIPPFDFYEMSPERQWCEDDEAPSYEDDDD